MAKSYYKFFLDVGFCLFFFNVFAQEHSAPKQNFFIKNFNKKELGVSSQNWNVAQDLLGQIYIANNQGILQFNGSTWHEIILTNIADARSLDSDKSGRIYVGGNGEIGYLYFNSKGKTKFTSLNNQLNPEELNFSDVWTTLCTENDYTYFQSPEYIFVFKKGKKIRSFPSKTGFHKSFKIKNKVFVRENGKGLYVLDADKKVQVLGGEIFSDIKIDAFIPTPVKNNYLIASRTKGLLFAKLFSINGKVAISINPIQNTTSNELIKNQVYHGIKSKQGGYILSTLLNGLYFLDESFNIVNKLNKSNGLKDNKIFQIFEDKNGNNWLTSESGVSFIESNLPISQWGEKDGLEGVCEDIIFNDNEILVATGLGLFKFENQKFEKLQNSPIEIWSLLKKDNSVFVGATSGFYVYSNSTFTQINDEYTNVLTTDKQGNIIQGGSGFIHFYKNINSEPFKSIEIEGLVSDIIQNTKGEYWISTRDNGVLVLDKNWKIYSIKTNNRGLKVDAVTFFELGDKLFAAGAGGTYQTSLINGKINFNSYNIDRNIDSIDTYNIYRISTSNKNQIALISDYEAGIQQLLYLEKQNNTFLSKSQALSRLSYGRINKIIFKDKALWLLGDDGLFEYYIDKSFSKNKFYPIISNIISNQDTLSFGSFSNPEDSTIEILSQPNEFTPTLSYDHHVYKFVYSATAFEDKEHIAFSSYLEGFDAGYSEWSNEKDREYTNIKEGTYVFHIKARDVYGNVSPEATFKFIVSPPWFRTWPAYISYVLLAILLIYNIVQLNIKRLKNQNIQLEKTISERTIEIRSQRDEIESQKKEITDSINYAKRIQGAVLPNQKQIENLYPNIFVLYKPKDIVSGDFYYLNNVNNHTYIAAADCTGHGVPGAFMSMIGLKILDQVINDNKETEPHKILYSLNEGINTFLRQNENKTHDGMEIALCVFDYEKMLLKFSMANRPLWLIRNNLLTEYKPTKLPIGGIQEESLNEYVGNEINIHTGDTIYIFSDGFPDQFGGDEGKKLMTKRFKDILVNLSNLPISHQKEALNNIMLEWKGQFDQVDDILVIGIKI
jgi:serine phosphatase RsbU (regulator of sigma subunit)